MFSPKAFVYEENSSTTSDSSHGTLIGSTVLLGPKQTSEKKMRTIFLNRRFSPVGFYGFSRKEAVLVFPWKTVKTQYVVEILRFSETVFFIIFI